MGSLRKSKIVSRIEALEGRRLLTATPLMLTGPTADNTFYLRENADHLHLDVWTNAATPGSGPASQSVLISGVSTVTANGSSGNDALTIDFSNGDPFPSTVKFAGSTGANSIVITGLNGTPVAIDTATITVLSTPISYTGTQSLAVLGSPANDTLTQTGQPSVAVTFQGGSGNDTLNVNAGEFVFTADPAADATSLTVNDNAAVFFAGRSAGSGINARHLAALNIGANASATLDSPASSGDDRTVLVLGSLSIDAAGRLDLSTNDLVIHNGNLPAVTGQIMAGSAGGTWKGASGITSLGASSIKEMSLAAEPNAFGATGTLMTSFDSQTVVRSDVLVKFAQLGDANLDGRVDGSDYTLIDAAFGSTATGWHAGDFNYDNKIDGSDYTLIDNEFNTQGAGDSPVYKFLNATAVAEQESIRTIGAIGASSNYPQYTNPDGSWSWVPATHWTAGFLPGTLWQLYRSTGDPYFLNKATQFTNPLAVDQHDITDVGFKIFDSYYPLLQQQAGNPAAVAQITQIMLNAAASKATQFNATVGAFKAWRNSTSGNPAADFNVLMDLIMDSNLLFWAAKNTTGQLSQTYYNEAVQNAVTEETYLVRPDGGSVQFAYFNSATGQFQGNEAYEGYSSTSTWSRGEAWAIYGFTLCAQQTGRADFLATAEKTADYFLAHLPADNVPYWDFNAPTIPNTYRDSSAASVAASGMLNLSKLIAGTDPINSARYHSAAATILASLTTSKYMNAAAAAGNGLLLHGALNVPSTPSKNDSAIIFGDYYFLEAVNSYVAGQASFFGLRSSLERRSCSS